MKKILSIVFLTWLFSLVGCVSSKLVQHNREYDTAVKTSSAQVYFATTKEDLLSIWGKNQVYYYIGSDSDFHYLNLYYDTYFKKKYYYKIPNSTQIDSSVFDFSKNTSFTQLVEFKLH
jgi:hypothetical protein